MLVLMSMNVAEIIMYIIFFHHVYRNDNGEGLQRLLEPGIIKTRNRVNAISFLGQFYAFVSEIGLWIAIGILSLLGKTNFHHELGVVIPIWEALSFALLSVVEVLSSQALRSMVSKPW